MTGTAVPGITGIAATGGVVMSVAAEEGNDDADEMDDNPPGNAAGMLPGALEGTKLDRVPEETPSSEFGQRARAQTVATLCLA